MVSRHVTYLTLVAGALALAGCNSDARNTAPTPTVSATPNSPATEAPVIAADAAKSSGAQLYQQFCSGCHGAKGQGVPQAGVALTDEAGEEAAELRAIIQNGKGKMPGLKDRVNDAEIAAIIEHLRTMAGSGHKEHEGDRD